MKIQTTAGVITARQSTVGPGDIVVVTGDLDTLQSLIDGLVMSDADSRPMTPRPLYGPDHEGRSDEHSMAVTKVELAIWVQFEILNYLSYTVLPPEMT